MSAGQQLDKELAELKEEVSLQGEIQRPLA